MPDQTQDATPRPEPWLRGTHIHIASVPRAVVHALELAREDVEKWCGGLSDAELDARPAGLAAVAFQLRHIARSVDRLLTYAEGLSLSADQLMALKSEGEMGRTREQLFVEFEMGLASAVERILALAETDLEIPRSVGKKQLPTTVGGLLIHVADHTQRHVGQAIVTAKVVCDQRDK